MAVLYLEAGKANAISPAFLAGLSRLLDVAMADQARAVILTGYATYFSAGLDLPALLSLDRAAMESFMLAFAATMRRVLTLPVPVVAAVNGHAVAGGCVLALQADYRIAVEGPYRIGLNETVLGLGLPAIVVETLRLRIPSASMLPLALRGRLVSPQEALELGLVDAVTSPETLLEMALTHARTLGEVPQPAFSQVKAGILRPVLEAVDRAPSDVAGWLETWFSAAARQRIAQAVERLRK